MSAQQAFNQPILITGGTGFVGSHLVEYLLSLGYQNIHVTSISADQSFVTNVLSAEHIHKIDLTDGAATKTLFAEVAPATVYHLASLAAVSGNFKDAQQVIINNYTLQMSVLDALVAVAPTARMVSISSGEVYGKSAQNGVLVTEEALLKPVNPYAVSKASQELLSLSYHYSQGLDIVVARPFNHTGERQTPAFVAPSFAQQIVAVERGQQSELKVGVIEKKRDFLDVKDVVAAYHLLAHKGVAGESYNIASGVATPVSEILAMMVAQSSASIQVSTDQAKVRVGDIDSIAGDAGKIRALGWEPQHALSETVGRILKYWRTQ